MSTPIDPIADAQAIARRFSTRDVAASDVPRYWSEVVQQTYFNLQLSFLDEAGFSGSLDNWNMGALDLSCLESKRLVYRRLDRHCKAQDPQVLITVPLESPVEFTQLGRTTRCEPGQYLLELSEEPYEFGYGRNNLLWVLKVPLAAVRERIGEPSRFCARPYDARHGPGRLFVDYVQLLMRHSSTAHEGHVRALMGQQVVDLLAVSLQQRGDALQSTQSVVRDAHLARVDAYVRKNLSDPGLTPARIAAASGVSLRYLHLLFKDTGHSASQWIRELRLQSAHENLRRAGARATVAQVAYASGFNDHAQFTHAFRKRFGCAPRDILAASKRDGGLRR